MVESEFIQYACINQSLYNIYAGSDQMQINEMSYKNIELFFVVNCACCI